MDGKRWKLLWHLLLALGCAPTRTLVTGLRVTPHAGRAARGTLGLCMATGRKSLLTKALYKASGALTVSIECGRKEGSDSTDKDLRDLSTQLRKSKSAVLWTSWCDFSFIFLFPPGWCLRAPARAEC